MHPEVLALLRALVGGQQRPTSPPWPPPPPAYTPPWVQPPPRGHVPVAPSYPMGFPYFMPGQGPPPANWISRAFPDSHRKRRA